MSDCEQCKAKDKEIARLKDREEAAKILCGIYFEIAQTAIPEEKIRDIRDKTIALMDQQISKGKRFVTRSEQDLNHMFKELRKRLESDDSDDLVD